jgi:hypothetical protein
VTVTSIRAPWRQRRPRDGRDGFDPLPAVEVLRGEPGIDGADGARGPRGLPGLVIREPAAAAPPLAPFRADFIRDESTRLVTEVRAPFVTLYPVRDADDLIEFVDVVPMSA